MYYTIKSISKYKTAVIWARGCVHLSHLHTRSANMQICHVLNLRICLGNNVVSYKEEQLI
jgi:hypothetical protein